MKRATWRVASLVSFLLLTGCGYASSGDRLGEFRQCLASCHEANCHTDPTSIPMYHRLLLWTCPSECDYACQHIVTDMHISNSAPIHQYHGKWPFHRFLGMQEPFSVLFSLLNYLAHAWGIAHVRAHTSPSYPLRKYYLAFGYAGLAAWTASMIFHTRDFTLTERADYFAAGANVLYGMYLAPVRIFRLDRPSPRYTSLLHAWTCLCAALYAAHVAYLTLWRWDYTYNMAANVAVGVAQNILWTRFAWRRYRASGKAWQAWPGMIVAWIILAMGLELFEFVPWRLMIDAHSLWHAGTVVPTLWWYTFLVKDAQEDMQTHHQQKE